MSEPRRIVTTSPPTPRVERIATGRREAPEPPAPAGPGIATAPATRSEVVDRVGLSIAQVAARDYRADHARCARIAQDMADVGAHRLAAEFRVFAFVALRASRAEAR